jgi:hypothetical protein
MFIESGFAPAPPTNKNLFQTFRNTHLFGLIHQGCFQPILRAFHQGLTPERPALSLTIGVILGIFPIPGTTTLLCSMAPTRLRLNFAVIQTVTYALYPAQLILMIPFVRMGACLLPKMSIPSSAVELITALQQTPWLSFQCLWQVLLGAVAAWLLLCLPFAWAFYKLLKSLLQKHAYQTYRS